MEKEPVYLTFFARFRAANPAINASSGATGPTIPTGSQRYEAFRQVAATARESEPQKITQAMTLATVRVTPFVKNTPANMSTNSRHIE
jgi:hypothetical protein